MSGQPYGVSANGDHWQGWCVDRSGRRRKFSIGRRDAMSRRSAMFAAQQRAAEMSAGGPGITLGLWCQRHHELHGHGVARATLAGWKAASTLLIERFGEGAKIDSISAADAMDFPVWLRTEKHKSDATVWGIVRRAKVVLGRAVDAGVARSNPLARVRVAQPGSSAWEYVSREQLGRILDACPSDGWRAVFALARLAGLRSNEIDSLRWDDIDWARRVLVVHPRLHRATTKKRTRECPIEPELHAILRDIFERQAEGEGPASSLGACNRERDAKVIIRRAKVAGYGKPLHALRKSLESDWIAVHPIADVCAWLGNSPAIAMKFYHRPTAESVARVTQIRPNSAAGVAQVQAAAGV